MQENKSDQYLALLLTVALHTALLLALYFGFSSFQPLQVISVAGSSIEAELIMSAPKRSTQNQSVPQAAPVQEVAPEESAPEVQPIPEPRPEVSRTKPQPAPQAPQPKPDTREQERAALLAEQSKEKQRREQEERKRQEQIDLTERQRQDEAERKQRLAKLQAERLKQLADLQRQRQQLTQQNNQAQSANAKPAAEATSTDPRPATPPQGNNGVDDSLAGKYALALQSAILYQWTRPETMPLGVKCRVHIVQLPGGQVISAKIQNPCPYDEIGRRSVEAAVLRASPLPYTGFESVFKRELSLNFIPQD